MGASNKKSPDRQGIQGKVFLDIVDDVFFSVLAHEKYNKSIVAGTSCHKTIYGSKFDGRKVRIECLHIVGKSICICLILTEKIGSVLRMSWETALIYTV